MYKIDDNDFDILLSYYLERLKELSDKLGMNNSDLQEMLNELFFKEKKSIESENLIISVKYLVKKLENLTDDHLS